MTRSGGTTVASGAKSCRLYGIMNSSSTGSTLTYTITVTDKNGIPVGTLAGITADTITATGILTGSDVQPNSLVAGATTSITTVFGSTSGMPHDGKIAITFPSGYYLAAAQTPICAGLGGGFILSVSGTSQLILTRDQSSTGTTSFSISCVVSNIKNPGISGSTGSYFIATMDKFNTVIATSSPPGDTLSAGSITSATIEPDTLVITATNTYSATFTAPNQIPSNGKLAFVFPTGINITGVSSTAITCSGLDGTLSTTVAGQTATALRLSGTTTTENSLINCAIRGVQNSLSAGTSTNYTLRTTSFADTIIDQSTAVPSSTFSATTTFTSASIAPSSVTINASPSYTINLNSTLGIPRDGKILVTFPSGINIQSASIGSCASLTGATVATSGQVLTISQTNATAKVSGSLSCAIIGIFNPSTSGNPGTYSIETQTANGLTIEQALTISGHTFVSPSTSSGGGGGGSSAPFTTPTFQTSNDPLIRKQIEERLAKLPVAQHALVKLFDDGNPNTQQDSAVYYVGSDGLRHAFPNSKTYFSWYCDFNGVIEISAKDLASIGLGRNIPYRSGSKLVKFTTDAKVYLITQNAELRAIPDEAFAATLFGANWNKLVDDISDAFYLDYTFGKALSANDTISLEKLLSDALLPSDSLRIVGYTRPNGITKQTCAPPKTDTTSTPTNTFKKPSSIPATFRFTTELSISSPSSIEIKYLQLMLTAFGSDIYPEGKITGNFGPATEAAVKRLQQKNTLPITGTLTPATRDVLNEKLK